MRTTSLLLGKIVKGGENVTKTKIKITSLLILLLMVFSTAPIYATDNSAPQWPQQGYDPQQTGQSPALGPQKNQTKWNYSIEEGASSSMASSPVVDSLGNVYFVGSYFNEDGSQLEESQDFVPPANNLYALYPNGTEKWKVPVLADFQCGPCSIGPDGTLYVPGSLGGWPSVGYLYAFSSNGVPLWNFTDPLGKTPLLLAPIVTSDGTIYIAGNRIPPTCDNGVYWALFSNGTPKWNFTPSPTRNQIKGYAIDKNGISYLGVEQETATLSHSNTDDGVLYAVYPNGTEKWNLNLDLPTMEGMQRRVQSILPSIGPNGMIYLMLKATFEEVLSEKNGDLNPEPTMIEKNFVFAVNPSGTQEWRYDLPENTFEETSLAISSDGIIYFGCVIGELLGIDPSQTGGTLFALYPNGTQKWNYTGNDIGFNTPIIGTDGTIYIANTGPRGENGQGGGDELEGSDLKDLENTPEPMTTAQLFAINPDGTLKWTIDNIASNFAAAIAKDGTMYLSGTMPQPLAGEPDPEPINEGVLYAIKGQTSNLYMQVTSSNNNPLVGDIITLTFKVGNYAQDSALGTIFTWTLPAGLEIVGNPWSDTTNQPVYNSTTRTITWNLGTVPYGDPFMWVNVRVLTDGLINIQGILNTMTYDPNIGQNLQILTVHAILPITTANAQSVSSTKTVGMQSTGTPLALVVLAMMAIFGGIWRSKRK